MAKAKLVSVMISSRCNDPITFGGKPVTLSVVRQQLKSEIEKVTLWSQRVFRCWINEIEAAREGTQDAWDTCLAEVHDADIVIVLYNGNAGWTTTPAGIGICHAELQAALESGPAKVRLVQLPLIDAALSRAPLPNTPNGRMKQYVDEQNLFRGTAASNGETLIDQVTRTLAGAIIELAQLGSLDTRKGRFDSGQALDWSRLDFAERKQHMEDIMRHALKERTGAVVDGDLRYIKLNAKHFLFLCHAVPAGMNVAAAREMVGMPFLRDHALSNKLAADKVGPVHLIACQKGVTEGQAINLLGFPDATIVEPSFGIYVADRIQNIQLLLLRNCSDESTTRHAIQRAFDWLERSGEAAFLVKRAMSRTRIVKVVAKEAAT